MAKILPLEEAVRRIDGKTPIGSVLRSKEWEEVPLALRERAQFSAGVTSAKLLSTIQERLSGEVNLRREALESGESAVFDRSSFIDAVREIARSEGLTPESGRGGITDITSIPRLGMIYDMQNQMATGFARWKMDQSEGALLLYPAWRLVRERDAKVPRDWRARWAEAGSAVGWEGASESPMVALKTSPIWARLSRFGTPWPPFDFNSGMGVEDVEREEAVELGLLKEGEIPEATGEQDFNEGLEASTRDLSEPLIGVLKEHFSKQIGVEEGKVKWKSEVASHERELASQRTEARELYEQLGEGLDVGRGISEAEVGGGRVSQGGSNTTLAKEKEAAFQYTVDQAKVQVASVVLGRKPLYHEYYDSPVLAARVARAIRNAVPADVQVRVDGDQVYVWRPGKSGLTFDQVSEAINGGQGGDMLGYGAKSLRDPDTVLVTIEDADKNVVAGFRAPRDKAKLWGKAREEDWTRATGQRHKYEVGRI